MDELAAEIWIISGLYSVSTYYILCSKSSLRPSQIQHLNQGRPLAMSDGASVGQENNTLKQTAFKNVPTLIGKSGSQWRNELMHQSKEWERQQHRGCDDKWSSYGVNHPFELLHEYELMWRCLYAQGLQLQTGSCFQIKSTYSTDHLMLHFALIQRPLCILLLHPERCKWPWKCLLTARGADVDLMIMQRGHMQSVLAHSFILSNVNKPVVVLKSNDSCERMEMSQKRLWSSAVHREET